MMGVKKKALRTRSFPDSVALCFRCIIAGQIYRANPLVTKKYQKTTKFWLAKGSPYKQAMQLITRRCSLFVSKDGGVCQSH